MDQGLVCTGAITAPGRFVGRPATGTVDSERACRAVVSFGAGDLRGFLVAVPPDAVVFCADQPPADGGCGEVPVMLTVKRILSIMQRAPSLSDARVRHAWMFVQEARDPDVKRQRLEAFTSLFEVHQS